MKGIQLGPIGQIAISVANLERSLAFYRDVLNLPLLFQAPPKMAFFDCHGIRLLIGEENRETGGSGILLYFRTGDIFKAVEALNGQGVEIHQPARLVHKGEASELYLAAFKDPDGHVIELMEERAL